MLVEGYSKAALKAQEAEQTRGQEVGWRKSNQLVGRTRGDQIVVFEAGPEHVGQLVDVVITAVTALTLHGKLGDGEAPPKHAPDRISLPTVSA